MQQAMAQGQQQFSAALRFAASPDCSQLHSVRRGTSALATLLRRGILRGKLSQGTEAKELDTNRLTKHCGWKRSIYWSANFLHSNRDAAPADRPATNTTGSLNPIEADVKRAQQLLLSLRTCQPHRGAANPPSQLEKNRGGRTGVGMVGGLPSVAGLLCLVPAFSVATSKATNKELRVPMPKWLCSGIRQK